MSLSLMFCVLYLLFAIKYYLLKCDVEVQSCSASMGT